MAKYLTAKQIERRKKVQQNLTVGAASLGLAAVGAKTGSGGLKMLKKAPRTASALGHATNVAGTAAGAMGSVSALSYSELKHRKQKMSRADEVLKLFDPEAKRHKRNEHYVTGLKTASVTAGTGSGIAALRNVRKPKTGTFHAYTAAGKIESSAIYGKRNFKVAAGLAAGSAAAAGGAALISHHAKRGGKTYTNKYEN